MLLPKKSTSIALFCSFYVASYFFLFLFLAASYYILAGCFCIAIVHMYCSICILLPMVGCCYLLLGWLSKLVAKIYVTQFAKGTFLTF